MLRNPGKFDYSEPQLFQLFRNLSADNKEDKGVDRASPFDICRDDEYDDVENDH